MTSEVIVEALGARIRVDLSTATADVEARVRAAWRDAATDGTGCDATVALSEGDPDAQLERLSVDVTLAALGHNRGRLVMFHAAGVALPDGRVVAFVGPSGRGKTTLSRALATEYGYVSDETVAVGDDLTVYPYRKPLSVVREAAPKDQVAPSAAGLRALPAAPLRLAALVLLQREEEPTDPVVAPVGLVEAVPDLVPQLSYLGDLSAPLARLAELVDAVGGVRLLRYSEASAVAGVLSALVDEGMRGTEVWARCALTPGERSEFSAPNIDDAIRADDQVMLLSGRTVQVLGGIAPELIDALLAGETREKVIERLVDRYGLPPDGDADAIVQTAVGDLEAAGVLSRSR